MMDYDEFARIHDFLNVYFNLEDIQEIFTSALSVDEFLICGAEVPMEATDTTITAAEAVSKMAFFTVLHGYSLDQLVNHNDRISKRVQAAVSFPSDPGECRAFLYDMLSPVYEAVKKKYASRIDWVANENLREIIEHANSFDDEKRFDLTIGLLFSDSHWKNLLAPFAYSLNLDPNVIWHIFDGLDTDIARISEEKASVLKEKKAVERALSKKEETVKDLERKLAESQSAVKKLKQELDAKPDIDLDSELQALLDESVKGYEDTIADLDIRMTAIKSERDHALSRLKQLKGYLKQIYVSAPDEVDEDFFHGIDVFVSSECADRYLDILSYSDNSMTDKNYTEVLDDIIQYVCARIKDGGTSIINTEFEWMSQVSLHFYKHNRPQGKFTRLFFLSDWKSEITIYDITTPADHQAMVASHNGHYQAIHDGNVAYDFSKAGRVEILRSLGEVLDE